MFTTGTSTSGAMWKKRDRKAIAHDFRHHQAPAPGRNVAKAEVEEYLPFAIELRLRVKEQLRRMGGLEYARINLSYISKETRQETFVTCKELGSTHVIPDTLLPPGDIFTVGDHADQGRAIPFFESSVP